MEKISTRGAMEMAKTGNSGIKNIDEVVTKISEFDSEEIYRNREELPPIYLGKWSLDQLEELNKKITLEFSDKYEFKIEELITDQEVVNTALSKFFIPIKLEVSTRYNLLIFRKY